MSLINMSKLSVAVLLCSITVSSVTQAQEVEYPAKPSPEHEVLKYEHGVWDAEITMMGPTGEEKSKGVETVTGLGELWNRVEFTYDFMGQPTTGYGVMGFNPKEGKFTGTWHEAGNPYATQMVGEYDAESETITYVMTGKDPAGNPNKMKSVAKKVDENNRTFELQMQMPGTDDFMTVMSCHYTKRDSENEK